MKVYLVLAIATVALLLTASHPAHAKPAFQAEMPRRVTGERQITVNSPFPGCVFFECRASCLSRGYKGGGYCTMNGCNCLH